jgi:hypothetical protein
VVPVLLVQLVTQVFKEPKDRWEYKACKARQDRRVRLVILAGLGRRVRPVQLDPKAHSETSDRMVRQDLAVTLDKLVCRVPSDRREIREIQDQSVPWESRE